MYRWDKFVIVFDVFIVFEEMVIIFRFWGLVVRIWVIDFAVKIDLEMGFCVNDSLFVGWFSVCDLIWC